MQLPHRKHSSKERLHPLLKVHADLSVEIAFRRYKSSQSARPKAHAIYVHHQISARPGKNWAEKIVGKSWLGREKIHFPIWYEHDDAAKAVRDPLIECPDSESFRSRFRDIITLVLESSAYIPRRFFQWKFDEFSNNGMSRFSLMWCSIIYLLIIVCDWSLFIVEWIFF